MKQRGIIWLTLLPYIIGFLAFAAIAYWVYHYIDTNWATSAGVNKGKAEIQLKWDQAVAEQRAKEETKIGEASTKKEQGDVKAKVIYRTITRNVDRIVTEYRDRACLDPDGVRAASDALRGPSAPATKPDKPMPKPDGTSGRPSSDGPKKAG